MAHPQLLAAGAMTAGAHEPLALTVIQEAGAIRKRHTWRLSVQYWPTLFAPLR